MHSQPLIEARSRAVIGAKALLRWRDPEQGMIPPIHFIIIRSET